ETLSTVYKQAPGLGRLLENLIEEKANLRLLDCPRELRHDPYSWLRKRLKEELKLAEIAARTLPPGAVTESSLRSFVSLLRFKQPKVLLQAAVADFPGRSAERTELGWWEIARRLRA